MSEPRTILFSSRHFPEVEFRGKAAVEAARKIRNAISRGKELEINETHVPVVGRLQKGEFGWGLLERALTGRLTLGADMLYAKTTTAALAWNVLSRMLREGETDFEFTGTPSYVSALAGFKFGNTAPVVFGRSSLLAALGEPAPERGYHARMRNLLACVGAILQIKEIIIAIPTAAVNGEKSVLDVDGKPGLYAVAREVPIGNVTIVNSLRFLPSAAEAGMEKPQREGECGDGVTGPRLLDDLCAAEARVDALRTGGRSAAELENEMLTRIRGMGVSAENTGYRWK
jgi:hypothetical protein